MPVKVTVPVTLVKFEDVDLLLVEVEASDKTATFIGPRGEAGEQIFNKWASETYTNALMKKRRSTGLTDSAGREVFEGDIVEGYHNNVYPQVRGVVKWQPDCAAFIVQGRFAEGGGWGTRNLSNISNYLVVGSVLTDPNELYPATKVVA